MSSSCKNCKYCCITVSPTFQFCATYNQCNIKTIPLSLAVIFSILAVLVLLAVTITFYYCWRNRQFSQAEQQQEYVAQSKEIDEKPTNQILKSQVDSQKLKKKQLISQDNNNQKRRKSSMYNNLKIKVKKQQNQTQRGLK